MKWKKTWLLVNGVLLLALVCSVVIYFARTWQYQDWVSAPGVVTDLQHYSGHKRSSSSYRIYFSFDVNGKTYQGSNLYTGKDAQTAIGETREIWYNPKNPNQSSFHKPSPGLDPWAPWILAVPVVLGLIVLPLRKRRTLT